MFSRTASLVITLVICLAPLALIALVIFIGRRKPGAPKLETTSSTTPLDTSHVAEAARPSPPAEPAHVAPPPVQTPAPPPPPAPVRPSKAALPLAPVEGEETEEVTFETLMVSSVVPRLRETSALGSANRVLDLKKQIITMGRAKDNDIVLKEEAASGHHCRLEKHGLSFRLVDLNSTNKTWVNGAEKQNVVLRNSDQIKVGDTTFIFELFGSRS